MSHKTGQVWDALIAAGMVTGQPPGMGQGASPWYVKVLLAFSGWLAALFMLGFLGMGFAILFKNPGAAFVVGGLMIGGAYAILRLPKNEFIEHLGLAVSLAGQALVIFAVFDIVNRNEAAAMLMVGLLQAGLAVAMPSFVHRVFSSCASALAFHMALMFQGGPDVFSGVVMLFAAWCWLNEFAYPRWMGTIRAAGYGLTLALVLLNGTSLFGYRSLGWVGIRSHFQGWALPWAGEILAGAVMLYVVFRLLRRDGIGFGEVPAIGALLGTFLLCVLSLKAPGILSGTMILILGFSGGNRLLMGLGIAALLFFIASYYYLLHATLLVKASQLLIVGLVLLGLRLLMILLIPRGKETAHA